METYADLTVLLSWIVAGGSVTVAGAAFAYLAENWAGWHTLRKEIKVLAPVFFSVILAILSTVLLQRQVMLDQIQPWWAILFQVGLSYVASQRAYLGIKAATLYKPK